MVTVEDFDGEAFPGLDISRDLDLREATLANGFSQLEFPHTGPSLLGLRAHLSFQALNFPSGASSFVKVVELKNGMRLETEDFDFSLCRIGKIFVGRGGGGRGRSEGGREMNGWRRSARLKRVGSHYLFCNFFAHKHKIQECVPWLLCIFLVSLVPSSQICPFTSYLTLKLISIYVISKKNNCKNACFVPLI